MTPKPVPQRYHSLDALRAVMMSLGIVIHTAITYMPSPTQVWALRDPERNVIFDYVVTFIHLFRMPTFFVVAGFFAAFLFIERGERDFIRNRSMRVLVPLVVFWPVIFPAAIGAFWFSLGATGLRPDVTLEVYFRGALARSTFVHLWFLYDLIIFYIAVVLLARFPFPDSLKATIERLFRAVLKSPFRAAGLGVISALTLIPMITGTLDTSSSYIPYWPALVAYGVYFGFGWMLYQVRDILGIFQKGAWTHLSLGLALFALPTVFVAETVLAQQSTPTLTHAINVVKNGLTMGFLVFGCIGLFMRHMETYSPFMRYFTDASYWIYLLHLPFAVWFAGLFAGTGFSAVTKFFIVSGLTTAVTVVTYHYFVRATFLGALLNGRRYPRSLPSAMHQAPPAGAVQGST